MQSGCFVCVCVYVGPFEPAFSCPWPIRPLHLCAVLFFSEVVYVRMCVCGDGAKGKTLTVSRPFFPCYLTSTPKNKRALRAADLCVSLLQVYRYTSSTWPLSYFSISTPSFLSSSFCFLLLFHFTPQAYRHPATSLILVHFVIHLQVFFIFCLYSSFPPFQCCPHLLLPPAAAHCAHRSAFPK